MAGALLVSRQPHVEFQPDKTRSDPIKTFGGEMASEPPKVFISYNRADRDWAEWIAGAIESAGYEPIIQARHFRPGENFVLHMQEAAAQTDFTIAVLSE